MKCGFSEFSNLSKTVDLETLDSQILKLKEFFKLE